LAHQTLGMSVSPTVRIMNNKNISHLEYQVIRMPDASDCKKIRLTNTPNASCSRCQTHQTTDPETLRIPDG
jgi:hypothetical protein